MVEEDMRILASASVRQPFYTEILSVTSEERPAML